MKETKFTPGPWKVDPKYSRDIQAPDGLDVATCCLSILNRKVTTEEESIANARLIAASPDMYEALKDLLDMLETEISAGSGLTCDFERRVLPNARSALSKARGEQ